MADEPEGVLTMPAPVLPAPRLAPRPADDPLARSALQRAQGMFQKWPEGFEGFEAAVTCETERGLAAGIVRVRPGTVPDVAAGDRAAAALVRLVLAAIAGDRAPRFFKDGDGCFPVMFECDDHPLGRGIRVVRPRARITYRLDGRGRVRVIERETATVWSATTIEDVVRTTPGRVLPARSVTRAVVGNAEPRVETVNDRHVRVEHVWLPAERSVTITRGGTVRRLVLRFHDHRLIRLAPLDRAH